MSRLLADRETVERGLDDEGGDAARAGLGVSLGVEHEGVGHGAVGDEHLGAVEAVDVALADGAGADADGVGAGLGFGERERADLGAAAEAGQIALLLLLGAVGGDVVGAEVGVGAVGESHGRGDAGELLGRDHAGEQAGVGAAVAFVDRDAVEAEVAEHRPEVGVPAVVAVHLVGDGVDFGVGEVADHAAE